MPKLLVLVTGTSEDVAKVAMNIAEGARRVRFAECDVRRVSGEDGAAGVHRVLPLDDMASLLSYDAIALGGDVQDTGALSDVLVAAEKAGRSGRLANKLGAVFPAEDPMVTGTAHPLWPLLAPMATYGMILVPPGYAGPSGEPETRADAAQRLGKRLIDIAGWITHARSHTH